MIIKMSDCPLQCKIAYMAMMVCTESSQAILPQYAMDERSQEFFEI